MSIHIKKVGQEKVVHEPRLDANRPRNRIFKKKNRQKRSIEKEGESGHLREVVNGSQYVT